MRKRYYKNSTANIILNSEILKFILLRQGIRQGYPLFPLLVNTVLEFLATAIRQGKKSIQIRKGKMKLSLPVDDMTVYIENPKESLKRILEPINEFSKVTGYNINT